VHIWRRSYDVRPPLLDEDDESHPKYDSRYKNLKRDLLPAGECLKDTLERFMPYWEDSVVPQLRNKKRVIISAHGNSLRALVKHLDGISDEEIPNLNIPTGVPLVYELEDALNPIKSYYLKD
jgi:2,3-bisphosphoglycerate-dependent phosphoglycerate mutase